MLSQRLLVFIPVNGILDQSALWHDQAFWSASKLCCLPLAGSIKRPPHSPFSSSSQPMLSSRIRSLATSLLHTSYTRLKNTAIRHALKDDGDPAPPSEKAAEASSVDSIQVLPSSIACHTGRTPSPGSKQHLCQVIKLSWTS